MKKRKLIMFTSLPKVGGHSTLTLGLCKLLSPMFSEIEVWVKVMPEHGHSVDAQESLERDGCRVVLLSDEKGQMNVSRTAQLIAQNFYRPPDLFFVLAMRNMSFVLRVLLVPSKGIYFHITHDLNRRTKRWLGLVERIFTRLVFICPATYQDFASRSLKSMWAPQSSELHGIETNAVLQRKRERRAATPLRISVGLSGRLTREKGAEVIVDFIRNCRQPCDFHIAGTGPFARDFETLAARSSERGPRVFFHGSYSPANRIGFLRGFFGEIDWLLVPSIDEWETLSMVTLEALQHGTPVLCSRAGGLRSFGMDELGPVSESIIKLVLPKDFSYRLSEIVAGPAFNLEERFTECRNYYASYFSDQRVFGRWKQIID